MHGFYLSLRSKKSSHQLLRYGFVGLLSNGIGYSVYLLVSSLGCPPKVTMTLLYGVGVIVSFIGNKKLTFADCSNSYTTVLRYLIAHLFGYIINYSLLFVFVDKLGYAHQLIQAISIFVVALFLFTILKFYVFSEKKLTPPQ